MNINEFLGKVRKHLGSESNEFLKLQFSSNTMRMYNKNLHYFITDKIDNTPLEKKLAYIFKPNRFPDNYISKISGLSKDVINKLRKDPKARFSKVSINKIFDGIWNFYDYVMAKHYGLKQWNQVMSVEDLRADVKTKQ